MPATHLESQGLSLDVRPPGVSSALNNFMEDPRLTPPCQLPRLSAKIFGLMKVAFLPLRSSSVTPRATEHLPQTKMGTRRAMASSTIAVSGGIATGITASITIDFIK